MERNNNAGNGRNRRHFEVRIVNERIRKLLDAGEENTTAYDDTWANTRYVEIHAASMTEAKERLDADYPAEAGFRVIAIIELRVRESR